MCKILILVWFSLGLVCSSSSAQVSELCRAENTEQPSIGRIEEIYGQLSGALAANGELLELVDSFRRLFARELAEAAGSAQLTSRLLDRHTMKICAMLAIAGSSIHAESSV